jgi:hypothetical protein
MAVERKPGSDRGRTAIDWQQAFHYYAALPPDQRDYRNVAEHFGVSVRTVERHGLNKHWRASAEEIDREAAEAARATLAGQRATKLSETSQLIDASYVAYAQQLRDGKVRISPADLARLDKLRRELWNESDATAPPPQRRTAAEPADPVAHKLEVLRALRDAGILDRLDETANGDSEAAA